MGREEQIIEERIKKIEELSLKGINLFPSKIQKKESCLECFNKKIGSKVRTAGRLTVKREFGKISFANIKDYSGEIQIVLQADKTPEEISKFFLKYVDIGDFVFVSGEIFKTKNGQKSILVHELKIITKSIRPLPEKYHGLKDEEERLRKRYLDLLLNQDVRDLFLKKEKFWNVVRDFMKKKGFIEVETPVLEVTTGGADARPFITHHNDFNIDVYLRISVGELWQKRLMAAGFEKTFEIGKVFRNEGSSAEHLQEFTNIEFYWAYADYRDGMNLSKELYRKIAKEVFGKTKFNSKGFKFDLSDEWLEIDYCKEILEKTKVDILKDSNEKLMNKIRELGIKIEGENRERLIDGLWKYCRKSISGPAFLINHPKIISPLAKSSEENPEITERFQIILAGTEVGNGYSELNNPIDQRQRFELQQKLREAGDEEAQMLDNDFIEMLEYGMPPVCGFGFGDRLFSILIDKPLRECVLFPLLKPNK